MNLASVINKRQSGCCWCLFLDIGGAQWLLLLLPCENTLLLHPVLTQQPESQADVGSGFWLSHGMNFRQVPLIIYLINKYLFSNHNVSKILLSTKVKVQISTLPSEQKAKTLAFIGYQIFESQFPHL